MKSKYIFLSGILFLIFTCCHPSPDKTIGLPADTVSSVDSGDKRIATVDTIAVVKELSNGDQDTLLGQWLRSDGTYRIEIRSATPDGKLDAGYFNPNPIHVEKADWIFIDNKFVINIVLRDKNYPGSTYMLDFNPADDILSGNYFQAVERVNYDVVFTRQK
jgi:hypothetical protein